jgi:hypothetical protein
MNTQSSLWSNKRVKTLVLGYALVISVVLVIMTLLGIYFSVILSESEGIYHVSTSTADVNGDGNLDVVLHNVRHESEYTAFGGITLWANQGNGKFAPQALPELQTGGWASAVADVDRDGDVDLVTFTGYSLFFILNQGGAQGGQTGEFKNNNGVNPPENARINQFGSLLLGDLNGDGQVDGVVFGCCGQSFPESDQSTPNGSWVWMNDWARIGRPVSDAVRLPALDDRPVGAAALGDLNGDGSLDLFAATLTSKAGGDNTPGGRVLINAGAGNFSDSGQQLGQTDSSTVALGDLDGDNDLDALVGTGAGADAWINQGEAQAGHKGDFLHSDQELSTGQVNTVFLSDLDGDGDLDAFLSGTLEAVIWWNDGQAVFSLSDQRFKYSGRQGLAVGDFNGDGRPDVFAGDGSTDYNVWINQGGGRFR